jgi:hypothetical protein
MAGKTGQSNHVRLKPAVCALVIRVKSGIKQQNIVGILLQTRPDVFKGQGLKKENLI